MSRSQSLALGRLDGSEQLVVIRPADVGVILEALRYSGEASAENGSSASAERRLIERISTIAHIDPTRYRVPEPDTLDWSVRTEEAPA